MKKKALIFIFLLLAISMQAQKPIEIVPQWKVGDVFTYQYNGYVNLSALEFPEQEQNEQPLKTTFSIEVMQKNNEGFLLSYRITDFKLDFATTEGLALNKDSLKDDMLFINRKAIPDSLSKSITMGIHQFLNGMKQQRLLLTTNEKGHVLRYENSGEINSLFIESMKPFIYKAAEILLQLFNMGKKNHDEMKEKIEQELCQSIAARDLTESLFPEIKWLFAYNGKPLQTGKWTVRESTQSDFEAQQHADNSVTLLVKNNLFTPTDYKTMLEETNDSNDIAIPQRLDTHIDMTEETDDSTDTADSSIAHGGSQIINYQFSPMGIVDEITYNLKLKLGNYKNNPNFTIRRIKGLKKKK